MKIADYFASLSIQVDKRSIAKVDKTLNNLEKKLKKFGAGGNGGFSFNIGRFTVDQRRLNAALGQALDIASQRTVFEISHFTVDQAHLNRVMGAAVARASASASNNARVRPTVNPVTRVSARAERGVSARRAAGIGGISGGLASLYAPALALGLGGYGLSNLNQRNQQVVAAQLQTQAVVQGYGGTKQQGEQSFDYLRNLGNRVGFNYLDASGDYNVLTSNLLGSGGSVEQSQNIFKGFSEYGRVNKLTPERQKLVFNALSQIAGKDKLQAEELTKQLGNSLPGAKDIFAQAYQKQTGGSLTGSDAIQALEAAMKKGQVRGNILNVAADIASQRAQPGLAVSSQASQAEQARYQNKISDLAVVASKGGVEEGFARIFRTLNAGLSESDGLVTKLANGFNEATKWADDLLLWPQSFSRALEGKDSLVADWLGEDGTKELKQDWSDIKDSISSIFGQSTPEWLPTLKSTTQELKDILHQIAEFQRWLSAVKQSPEQEGNVSFWDRPITATFQQAGRFANNASDAINASRERGNAVYGDPNSPYFGDAAGYDAQQKDAAVAAANDKAAGYVENRFSFGDITITIPLDSAGSQTPEEMGTLMADWFTSRLEETLTQFPQKE